jgi:hypothetical protein
MKTMTVRAALALFAVFAAAGAPRCEVSINGQGREIYFQAEPGRIWTLHRNGVPSAHVLNPFGDARGDGAPAIARNPMTLAWEVAWGRAGASPGVAFAHFDAEADAWQVRDVTRSAAVDPWSGRTVQLVHDDWGNRFIGYLDVSSGAVLLASAPRDSHEINRAIVVSQPGVRGSMPALYWDGDVIVIGYARPDGGLDIVHLRPDVDDEGRIPNAGIGVPGIPDLQVSVDAGGDPMRLHATSGPGTAPIGWPGDPHAIDPAGDEVVPPMVRIEAAWGDRLLATWLESPTELGYVGRVAGSWSFVGTVPLDDALDHEAARAEALRLLTGSGRGRIGR